MASIKDHSKNAVIDETSAAGTPVDRKGKTPREDGPNVVPKTSGAPAKDDDTSKSPVANRNPGPRVAGETPRPTDTPIVGGDRGRS